MIWDDVRRIVAGVAAFVLLLGTGASGCQAPPLTPENYRAKIAETKERVDSGLDGLAEAERNFLVKALPEMDYVNAVEQAEKTFASGLAELESIDPPTESPKRFTDIHEKYVRALEELIAASGKLKTLPDTDGKARDLLVARTRKEINNGLNLMERADESLQSHFEKEAAKERRRQERAESDEQ